MLKRFIPPRILRLRDGCPLRRDRAARLAVDALDVLEGFALDRERRALHAQGSLLDAQRLELHAEKAADQRRRLLDGAARLREHAREVGGAEVAQHREALAGERLSDADE